MSVVRIMTGHTWAGPTASLEMMLITIPRCEFAVAPGGLLTRADSDMTLECPAHDRRARER